MGQGQAHRAATNQDSRQRYLYVLARVRAVYSMFLMPPDRMIGGIFFLSCLFVYMSVCLFVCRSVVNFNIRYNF